VVEGAPGVALDVAGVARLEHPPHQQCLVAAYSSISRSTARLAAAVLARARASAFRQTPSRQPTHDHAGRGLLDGADVDVVEAPVEACGFLGEDRGVEGVEALVVTEVAGLR